MTKTILFISPTGTLDNGAEISIVNLMKFLVDEGYRVLNVFPDKKVPSQEEYRTALQNAGIETYGLKPTSTQVDDREQAVFPSSSFLWNW